MATGNKVNNGVISMAIPGSGAELQTLLELYKARGARVGPVTSDAMTGATPAGFVDHKPGGTWDRPTGWASRQGDFDTLADTAAGVAADLVTPELRAAGRRVADHLILGIDVWPTPGREPHAEVACRRSALAQHALAARGADDEAGRHDRREHQHAAGGVNEFLRAALLRVQP